MNLKNASALVTGGSSGIGHGIAQALIAAGARVAITGRNQGAGSSGTGTGRASSPADVQEVDVQRTMGRCWILGELDILVNNAGVGVFAAG